MSLTIEEMLAAGDIQGIMRACHTRRLEREGIPMVLGLADERREIPPNTDAHQLASGQALDRLLREYHQVLVPFSRSEDEGALITAMQVVAYTHFEPGAAETHRSEIDTARTAAGDEQLTEGVRI